MVDRTARDQTAKAMRSYMNEEITAFQFDEAIEEVRAATEDKTVDFVREELWYYYDDCKDHIIQASKEIWDYFNRLLLLLESDREVHVARGRWRWGLRQAVAVICFIIVLLSVLPTSIAKNHFIFLRPYWVLFGLVSIFLSWLRAWHIRKTTSAMEMALDPFPTLTSLLAVRREVAGFTKMKYRVSLEGRRIRKPIIEIPMKIHHYVTWCMFSPFVLFIQMLPERDRKISIELPAIAGADRIG